MSYNDLYEYCQSLEIHISRKLIKKKLCELTDKPRIATAVSGALDPAICRGLYLSPNADHPFAEQHGCDVVVISRKIRDSNKCWDRIITVKEMLHIFDDIKDGCDNGDKFDALLSRFAVGESRSDHAEIFESETRCFWRALGLFCPEPQRLKFAKSVAENSLTNYDVALRLRIPELYVPHLLRKSFPDILSSYK